MYGFGRLVALVYIRRPCGTGTGQSEGSEASCARSSDPMREAGAPSTGGWVVPAPPGIVILAPPEIPRNAQQGKVKAALPSKRR